MNSKKEFVESLCVRNGYFASSLVYPGIHCRGRWSSNTQQDIFQGHSDISFLFYPPTLTFHAAFIRHRIGGERQDGFFTKPHFSTPPIRIHGLDTTTILPSEKLNNWKGL